MKKTTCSLLAAATLMLAPTLTIQAGAGHDHGQGHSHGAAEGDHGHDHGAAKDDEHGSFETPKTVPAAWTMVQDSLAKSKALVEEEKWAEVHSLSNAFPVAIQVLTEKSDMVEEGKRKRLDGALTQLKKAATKLHIASENKDAKASEKAFKEMDGLIKLAQAMYPAEALPTAEEEKKS